ncbi:amino acid permease [Phragmitibacter flavus]|uniref:Amino acid permease n=1 Tax=Phragmitibacter flavus TaxID=2576071 RepID=A0A5R8KAJ2_9BACT|nr:amino acid permease [Phragmitibacter flavus]TLD69332.1 amino acid permease [Phragmitibacter flavus]
MASTTISTSNDGKEPELRKSLGAWQVALYGLGSMLGAGIYALVGKAAGTLGNAIWLAFLAAMVVAMLTGLSYACVGSRYARAGGAAYVTHRALKRPWLSYVVGLCVTMSGLTSMATGSQAMAETLGRGLNMELPVKLVAIFIVLLVGLVIYRGIRESMWLNILCTGVEAVGLLFIIAVGMRFWGGVDYMETPVAQPGEETGNAILMMLVLQGAVLMFFSFIGFEDILNISEEVKNPERNVPIGLLSAMVVATMIYMAVAITAVSVIPWQELSESKAPLMEVAKKAAPWFNNIDTVYIGITLFAIGNTALLNYIMGSRLLYGMSRQGLLPPVLGKVHHKRRTPHVAIMVLFVVVTGLILSGNVKALAESTVLLLLMVFTMVNISLLVLKLRPGEPRGGFEVPLVVPILGALVCLILIAVRVQAAWTSADPQSHVAPLVALAIVVVSLGLFFLLKPFKAMTEGD